MFVPCRVYSSVDASIFRAEVTSQTIIKAAKTQNSIIKINLTLAKNWKKIYKDIIKKYSIITAPLQPPRLKYLRSKNHHIQVQAKIFTFNFPQGTKISYFFPRVRLTMIKQAKDGKWRHCEVLIRKRFLNTEGDWKVANFIEIRVWSEVVYGSVGR